MRNDKEPQKRNTRQRRMIYEAVLARCDHPSADEIYMDVHQKDSQISKGTVYRNLNLLAEEGKITHVKLPAADKFDKRVDLHYHVLCVKCGRVYDVPMEYQADCDSNIAQKTGFLIQRHRMLFEGVCPDCQAEQQKAEKDS